MIKTLIGMFGVFFLSSQIMAGNLIPGNGYVTSNDELCTVAPSCVTGWSKVTDASGAINVNLDNGTITINGYVCSIIGCVSLGSTYEMVQWDPTTGKLQAIDSSGKFYSDLFLKYPNSINIIKFGSESLGYMLGAEI